MDIFGNNKNASIMIFLGNLSYTEGWGYFDDDNCLWFKPKGDLKFKKVMGIPKEILKYNKRILPHYNPFSRSNDGTDEAIIFHFGLEDCRLLSFADNIPQTIIDTIKSKDAQINSLINNREELLNLVNARSIEDARDKDVISRYTRAKQLTPYMGSSLNAQNNNTNKNN